MTAARGVFVEAVGLAAPGLPGWAVAQEVLRGDKPYQSAEMPRFAPNLLPPNERRRATKVGRLAFQAAEEAVGGTDIPADGLAAVFATSGGDYDVNNRLCEALATPERAVSPTDFHNSVHNAPAGYWSIATHSRMPSTSLSAYDSSFAVGLMEAASMCLDAGMPVLLVAYDMRPPPPIGHARVILDDFTMALILTPERRRRSQAMLHINPRGNGAATSLDDAGLEQLRLGNPAARSLPLLAALARKAATDVRLPCFDRSLGVAVAPC